MSKPPTIEVEAYAGNRGNQRPRVVVLDGRRFEVVELIDAWISTGIDSTDPVEYGFLVRCIGGYRFRLIYAEHTGWSGALIPGPHACDDPESTPS